MSEIVIKEIKPQKKPGLYSIITEDGFEFSLTAKGIYENCVKAGSVFTQKQFDDLRAYALAESSYRYAVYLLGVRDMSSGELKKKLSDKGKVTEPIISRLEEQGYINDGEYAKKIIKKYRSRYGKRRIEQELYKRDLPKELWQEDLELACVDAQQTLSELIADKMKGRPFCDRKERDRVYSYFLRQGFGYEDITRAFREYDSKVGIND